MIRIRDPRKAASYGLGDSKPVKRRGRQKHQELVNSCVEWLTAHGIVCCEFKQYTGPGQRGGWIKQGKNAKGWPDIVGLWSSTYNLSLRHEPGKFFGVEIKLGRDVQSDEQRESERRIKRAGGLYFVVDSMETLVKIFG